MRSRSRGRTIRSSPSLFARATSGALRGRFGSSYRAERPASRRFAPPPRSFQSLRAPQRRSPRSIASPLLGHGENDPARDVGFHEAQQSRPEVLVLGPKDV